VNRQRVERSGTPGIGSPSKIRRVRGDYPAFRWCWQQWQVWRCFSRIGGNLPKPPHAPSRELRPSRKNIPPDFHDFSSGGAAIARAVERGHFTKPEHECRLRQDKSRSQPRSGGGRFGTFRLLTHSLHGVSLYGSAVPQFKPGPAVSGRRSIIRDGPSFSCPASRPNA
jgi:hypothetical protein